MGWIDDIEDWLKDWFVTPFDNAVDAVKRWLLGVSTSNPNYQSCIDSVTLWQALAWAVQSWFWTVAGATERVVAVGLLVVGAAGAAYAAISVARARALTPSGTLVGVLAGATAYLGWYLQHHHVRAPPLPGPCLPSATYAEAVGNMTLSLETGAFFPNAVPPQTWGDFVQSPPFVCSTWGSFSNYCICAGVVQWTTPQLSNGTRAAVLTAVYQSPNDLNIQLPVTVEYNPDEQTVMLSGTDGSTGLANQGGSADTPYTGSDTGCPVLTMSVPTGILVWFVTAPSATAAPVVFLPQLDKLPSPATQAVWDPTAGSNGAGALRAAWVVTPMAPNRVVQSKGAGPGFLIGDAAALITMNQAGLDLGFGETLAVPAPAKVGPQPLYIYQSSWQAVQCPATIPPAVAALSPAWDATQFQGLPSPSSCNQGIYTSIFQNSPLMYAGAVTPAPPTLVTWAMLSGGFGGLPVWPKGGPNAQVLTYQGLGLIGLLTTDSFVGGDWSAGKLLPATPTQLGAWQQPAALWVPVPPPWNNNNGGIVVVPYGSPSYPPWATLPTLTVRVVPGPQAPVPPWGNGYPKNSDGSINWNMIATNACWTVSVWITWPAGTPSASGPTTVPITASWSSNSTNPWFVVSNAPSMVGQSNYMALVPGQAPWPSTFSTGPERFAVDTGTGEGAFLPAAADPAMIAPAAYGNYPAGYCAPIGYSTIPWKMPLSQDWVFAWTMALGVNSSNDYSGSLFDQPFFTPGWTPNGNVWTGVSSVNSPPGLPIFLFKDLPTLL